MRTSAIAMIQDAMEGIGEYDPANTITDADQSRSFKVLNRMMEQWSNENLACFAFLTQSILLQPNKAQYTIGPFDPNTTAPDIIGTRPLKIEQAYLLDPQGNRYFMAIDTQYDFNLLTNTNVLATSQIPTDFFYDPQSPVGIINVWPIPTPPMYTLYWTSYLQLNEFPNLYDLIDFPPGYEAAITANLMVKMSKYFGKAVTPDMQKEADDTKGVIKRKNSIAQPSHYDPVLSRVRGAGFNIWTGTWGNRGP